MQHDNIPTAVLMEPIRGPLLLLQGQPCKVQHPVSAAAAAAAAMVCLWDMIWSIVPSSEALKSLCK